MNEKVSVVVPVYNVEQYLAQCVESVLGQTYTNLEIILVDDGSPDNCPEICDAYAAQDSRVKVIHKRNGGLSDARNAGIETATGAYITFIDSDDYVAADYVEQLYKLVCEFDADIAIAEQLRVFESGSKEGRSQIESIRRMFTRKEAVLDQLQRRHITASACGRLFKANIFNDIRFPVGEVYEDLAIIYTVLLAVEKIAYSDRPLYMYRARQGSIMQRPFEIRQYAEVRWIEQAMELVETYYPEFDDEIRGRRVWSYFKTLYRILCSKDRTQHRAIQDEMIMKIKNNAKGLVLSKRIDTNLKIKIGSLYFGKYGYYAVQKISDCIKQLIAGHRYTV